VVFAASTLGGLDLIEEPLYDSLLRMRSASASGEAGVLLVEAEPGVREDDLLVVIEELRRLGAVGIAVTSMSSLDPTRLEALARAEPEVVLGVSPVLDSRSAGELAPPADLPEAHGGGLAWVSPGLASSGVHRCQLASLTIGGLTLPTVEWMLAGRSGSVASATTSGDCFRIDFRGDVGSLPRVSVERVVSNGLIPELVEGRRVLIGAAAEDAFNGLRVPTNRGMARMSLLEFQGHALETLISGSSIRRPSQAALLALFIGVAAAFQILRLKVGARHLTPLTLGFALVIAFAVTVLFVLWRTWLPAAALVLEVGALYLVATRHQVASGEDSVRRLLHGFLTRLRSLIRQDSLYTSDDPWTPIAELVRQTLQLNRTIFLEAVPGDHRVREIFAVDCSLDDIDERRRDFWRSPYRDALRKAGPLRVDGAYLRRGGEGESQFLVPLTFGQEILGFWALSVPREAESEDFERTVADYAEQIGEMLYQRQWLQRGANPMGQRQNRSAARSRDAYRALQWVSAILERRLLRAESLLRGLGSAVVVYDLFGRLLDVTGPMRKQLERCRLSAHELTALDLVVALVRCTPQEAREHLSTVVRKKTTVSLPAYVGDSNVATTLMLLAPIAAGDEQERLYDATPFGVLGISLELLDTSSRTTFSEVKARLSERLGSQVEADLHEVSAALAVMRDPAQGAALRQQLIDVVGAKIDHLLAVVTECQQYLSVDLDQMREGRYPMDAAPCLSRVVDERSSEAGRRRIDLQLGMPEHLGQVLAAPDELERGLRAMLEFLLDDAEEGHPLWIRVEEFENETAFRFSNRGYGFAQDKLDEILDGEARTDRGSERKLAGLRSKVELWGGSLGGQSDIGVGTHLELRLHRLKHV
jgi:CHASE2 domain-containing sensor protein/signal transduction histidine kinase